MALEVQVGQLFPTPLISTTLEDVDAGKIAAIVYSLRDAGFMFSGRDRGGAQTQGNFFLIDHPEVRKLRDRFFGLIHAFTKGQHHPLLIRGWAVILSRGDASADIAHNHLPYHWSAVYYPQVPALSGGQGNLLLYDPREVFIESPPAAITPHTGMLVMFPSWLRHTVEPVSTIDGDRISISLNATIGPPPDSAAANCPPHRLKKRAPGETPPQEFDPTAAADFPYPP
jgi:hypothetical protein